MKSLICFYLNMYVPVRTGTVHTIIQLIRVQQSTGTVQLYNTKLEEFETSYVRTYIPVRTTTEPDN